MARIIDERGRLFGRVSLVDLLVGLVLVVAVVMAVRAYRLVPAGRPPTTWIAVTVFAPDVLKEVEQMMTSHREERNLDGEVIARVERIVQREPTRKLELGKDGSVRAVEDNRSHNLLFRLGILAQREADGLFYKSRKVKAGIEIIFEPAEYSVTGKIVAVERPGSARREGG
ncbi:MAG: DUF4330 family protein [Deltaproteobacteria bacterium]|nr:DUF4330 family protein [Deltaproteobacteria bacterium]